MYRPIARKTALPGKMWSNFRTSSGFFRRLSLNHQRSIKFVKLMKHEGLPLYFYTPPSRISFYKVNKSTCKDEVVSHIRNRFNDILTMNPWLCGRLMKQKVNGETDVYLTYNEQEPEYHRYFTVKKGDEVFKITDPVRLCDYLVPLKPKKGIYCEGKDEQLCELMVFQGEDVNKIAIMLTVNHCIADAWTLVELWKMLDVSGNVSSMTVERRHDFIELVERNTELKDLLDIKSQLFSYFFPMMRRGLVRKLLGKTPPQGFIYKVNTDEVNKLKSYYNNYAAASYVSTNDILCSWFFGIHNKNDLPMMLVNFRNRLDLGERMAGNYFCLCPIRDFETPDALRDSWKRMLSGTCQVKLNLGWNAAEKVDVGWRVTTDWASNYHTVELAGCTHMVHLPVVDVQMSMLGIPNALKSLIAPFRLNNNELAVFIRAYNDGMTEELFDQSPLLGEKVLLK